MRTTKPQSFQEMCFLYTFLRRGFEFLIFTYFHTLLLAFEVSLNLGTFFYGFQCHKNSCPTSGLKKVISTVFQRITLIICSHCVQRSSQKFGRWGWGIAVVWFYIHLTSSASEAFVAFFFITNVYCLSIISICNQVSMQTKPEHVVVDMNEKRPERNFAKQTKKLYGFLMLCFKKGLQKCLFSKRVTFNLFLVF